MSERGPENFDSENKGDTVVEGDATAQSSSFEKSSPSYESPMSYIINGTAVSVEDLYALKIPEFTNDPEAANFSPEDKEVLGGLLADVAEIAHIAQLSEASKEAKVAALGNAFFASQEGETMSEEQAQQMKEAQRIVSEPSNVGPFFAEKVNTKWKKWFAAVALAIGASAMPQLASARGGDFRGFISPPIAQRAEQGVSAMDRIDAISKRQQDITIEMGRLEQQKSIIAQRSAGQGEVASLGNRYENKARVMDTEARYEAGLKQIEAKRLEAEAKFAKKANPTEADRMKHEARLKKIEARATRLEGAYDVAQAREEGRHVVRHSQIRNESWNTYATIAEIEAQQQRLMTERNLLEQEKGSILLRAGINVFRR